MTTAPADALALTLELICEDVPPANAQGQAMEFGAQDKAGTLHAGAALDGRRTLFALPLTVRISADGSSADFAGPFVHGGPGGRFLYLGYRPAGETAWTRRWKIPLAAITAEQVRAATSSGSALTGRISASSGSTAQLLGPGWTFGEMRSRE
jgi:hypothetical protein